MGDGGSVEVAAAQKPLLRGVSHQVAFFGAVVAGLLLLRLASGPRATMAAGVYAGSLALLFGVSALFHRPTWGRRAYRWMRRLDHSVIFVLVAGTTTPFCLALPSEQGQLLLTLVWGGAVLGALRAMFWMGASKPFIAATYLLLGWTALAFLPDLYQAVGPTRTAWVFAGGLLYSLGAVVYAARRPNPWPRVFGFHEVFHVLVILAASCHFVAVANLLPTLG